jgi:hypothetical protein
MLIIPLSCLLIFSSVGKHSRISAEGFAPHPHSAYQPDLAAFPARTGQGYKVIAGPRVISQVAEKSPYDHLPIQAKVPQPYAYGWFGGVNNQKWTRQFGYGRRYTQWTLK